MKGIWKEVFKAGRHTDMSGVTHEYTLEDLKTIVEKYNQQTDHEAPVVIGHPKIEEVAYGWVKELKLQEESIYAYIDEIDPAFAELVNAGRYKKVSIALNEDMLLRHVGYLGAVPPAVKGLKDAKFSSEKKYVTIEYNENNNFPTNKGAQMPEYLKKLIAYLSSAVNAEAGTMLEKWIKDNPYQEPQAAPANGAKPSFSDSDEYKQIMAQFTEQAKQIKESKEENALLKKQLSDNEFDKMFSEQVNKGILIPAQKQAVKILFDSLDNKSVEFADGDTKTQKTTKEIFESLLSSFKPQVAFAGIADNGRGNERTFADIQKDVDEKIKSMYGGN